MAASVTHLVVGERTFTRAPRHESAPGVYGAFLMGCILVDVHAFHPIDRRVTHFVGRVEEDGEAAYRLSCSNFLQQLGRLLQRPWPQLDANEQAFVMGYLCHLAVDECWKALGKKLFDQIGINNWADFPIPGDISLTTFDHRCFPHLIDPAGARAALETAPIPDVFRHVSHQMLQSQWRIIREYILAGATAGAHLDMLEKAGRPRAEIDSTRKVYAARWDEALDFNDRVVGGVDAFLDEATARSLLALARIEY